MKNQIEELDLNTNYIFEDLTLDVDGESFICSVELSPDSITLKVNGDCSETRKLDLDYELDTVKVHTPAVELELHGLHSIGPSMTGLDSLKGVFHIQYIYEVKYALYFPHRSFCSSKITCLSYKSSELINWVGDTKTQKQIVNDHSTKNLNPPYPDILFCETEELILRIAIIINQHSSVTSTGITTTPTLAINAKDEFSIDRIFELNEEIGSLISLFLGIEMPRENILLHFDDPHVRPANLYYSTGKISRASKSHTALFPLSKDSFPDWGWPELPTEAFLNFVQLPKSKKERFIKYLRYKRLNTMEDRFLGFFRLLESLCFKESAYLDSELLDKNIDQIKPIMIKRFRKKKMVQDFLKRLPRLNKSRYNTQTCLRKFLETLPSEIIAGLKFSVDDLKDICRLRNDITHANEYYVSENKLTEYTYFIEMLLILALFKELGIPHTTSMLTIHRMSGYYWIRKAQY